MKILCLSLCLACSVSTGGGSEAALEELFRDVGGLLIVANLLDILHGRSVIVDIVNLRLLSARGSLRFMAKFLYARMKVTGHYEVMAAIPLSHQQSRPKSRH